MPVPITTTDTEVSRQRGFINRMREALRRQLVREGRRPRGRRGPNDAV